MFSITTLLNPSTFIIAPFGSGLRIYFRMLNWNLIGFGMLKSYISLMVKILYAIMMSHGLQIDFGRFK